VESCVNFVMNLWVPENAGKLSSAAQLVASEVALSSTKLFN
jgi:hypothetical protein